MGQDLSKEELVAHKENALNKIDKYITSLIESECMKTQSKANKLSYWLEDWTTFIDFEKRFSPSSLRRYKRGEIIKAHLGYNVGSEEGGLHYCIVLDKRNSIKSSVITIVPLTSVKNKTDLKRLHRGSIYLGNELFTNLNSKISFTEKTFSSRMVELDSAINALTPESSDAEHKKIRLQLDICHKEMNLLERMRTEVSKMKIGSIALTGQIRSISKIRIYDPKTNHDILSGVKLSNEKLDLLDREILNNFTNTKL